MCRGQNALLHKRVGPNHVRKTENHFFDSRTSPEDLLNLIPARDLSSWMADPVADGRPGSDE